MSAYVKYEYDNMANNNLRQSETQQPLNQEGFYRAIHRRDNQSQYAGSSIAVHDHDNINSPPVAYTNLRGVQRYLFSATIILSPAQIKALHTTPIVLVKPPSARSFIYVDSIAGRLSFGTTPYTGTNNLEFRYTNGSGLKVCADMPATVFLDSAVSTYSYSPAPIDQGRTTDFNFTPVGGGTAKNGQIVVSVPNANPAAGNSTVTLIVYYRVISFVT